MSRMKKMPSFVVERDKAFYQWLATRTEQKQLAELYSVIPFINGYGQNRKCFNDSIFELNDSESAQKLLDMIDGDKRFKFMHYGHTKNILMLLDSYCKFLDEKEGSVSHQDAVSQEKEESVPVTVVQKASEPPLTASRAWSKYEVALLIETYNKAATNGYLRAAAEVLSHTLREWAVKQGKSIDATYRNVNGITMQLGTVQYCFTNGKKGLPNASTQIKEMVELYKYHFSDYEKLLQEAHQLLKQPGNEIAVLLSLPEYAPLREELKKHGITTVDQLKDIDLWLFMNRYGVYSIRERQDICKRVNALIKPPESDKNSVQYCLKTEKGRCFYGNTPGKALAAFCDDAAQSSPLSVRKLIGQRNSKTGLVVLHADIPMDGGIALANVRAYLDKSLNEETALQYGLWLSEKLQLLDRPESITVKGQQGVEKPVAAAKTVSDNKPDTPQPATQAKPQPEQDKKAILQEYAKQNAGKVGEEWLFSMLSAQKIKYEDKRKNQGCLWISGGHELDDFVNLCPAKGYKFHYKADGYKAFSSGAVWWTTDCVEPAVAPAKPVVAKPTNNQTIYSRGIWSLKGDQLQFKGFDIKIPSAFNVLHKERCDNHSVAFYPEPADSYATLRIWNVDKEYNVGEGRKAFADYVTSRMVNKDSPKTEFATVKESSSRIAYLSKISYETDYGRGNEYIAFLYNKSNKWSCMSQIFVDANDDGAINYDNAFNELIESVLAESPQQPVADQKETDKVPTVAVKPLSEISVSQKNWNVKGHQLQFKSFKFEIPSIFDALYEERCDDDTAAFYPRDKECHAILTIENIDEAYASDSVATLLGKIISEKLTIGSSPNTESTSIEDSEYLTSMAIKFSKPSDGQIAYEYIGILKNRNSNDACVCHLFVNGTDIGKNNYDSAYKDLVKSALRNSDEEARNKSESKEDNWAEEPVVSSVFDQGGKIWSVNDNQLRFMSYNITVPDAFDVLYEKQCDNETVSFYPERKNSYATLQIKSLDKVLTDNGITKMTVSKEQIKNAFNGIVSSMLKSNAYSKVDVSETRETSVLIAQIGILSFLPSAGRGHIYCCLLFNKINKDCCSLLITVDRHDEGYFNYGKAFNELVESTLRGSTVEAANGQNTDAVPVSKLSTENFRYWLEQDFRMFMAKKGFASKTVSQYCQSIEAVEQFIRKRNLSITLENVGLDEAQAAFAILSARPDFKEWNKKGHHQYSAALVQYVDFLKSKTSGMQKADVKQPIVQQVDAHGSKNTSSIREIVIRILNEAKRPMTVGEIYTEIERRHLYIFNSNNPRMIVDHTVRKSCVGIKIPNHTKEDVFDRVFDENGVSKYYLIEWGKPYLEIIDEESEAVTANRDSESKCELSVPNKNNRWVELLAKYFPDGFILDDFLSQLQAKTYWQEAYDEECPLDGAAIDEAMKAIGEVRDGRVFVANEEESGLIEEICSEIAGILDEYSCVYRKCIYDRYQDKLAKFSIYTESIMEEQVLEKAKGSFYCSWKIFLRKGQDQSVAEDCRKVLRNHGGAMPVADVQKILWFIPGDIVYHTMSLDKEAMNIGNSVWMLAEHFPLTVEEADTIGNVLDEYFISHDFIQAADLLPLFEDKLPAIADNLKGLHFSAVFGIVKYYLEDRFSYTRAILAPKGAPIDFSVLFQKYAAEHERFTLDEVSAFAKEIQIQVYFESLYIGGAVRINADEFVHKSSIQFDVEETDKILESICLGDYMPFYAVSSAMMMHLPPCGYQWNGYLLLNYVYSFSKIFRASYKSIGKTGYYGAMVRRDCQTIGNYKDLLVRVLTDDDTWSTVEDARELIVKHGYQALKDIGGIDKIVSQAKHNKLKD